MPNSNKLRSLTALVRVHSLSGVAMDKMPTRKLDRIFSSEQHALHHRSQIAPPHSLPAIFHASLIFVNNTLESCAFPLKNSKNQIITYYSSKYWRHPQQASYHGM